MSRADRPFVAWQQRSRRFALSLADASVDPFPQQVGVAAVAGVLLDHVDEHVAQRDDVSVSRNRLSLRPLGEHVLRGLRGQTSVYQVIADGLPTEFPVLHSAEHLAGNLPRQVTSLVGRDDLVRQGAELVRDRQLVTLTGVGGVGKTRMALEVGAELAGEFPDGVWMVELAAVSDPGSIPAAIATVLGITPQGDTR